MVVWIASAKQTPTTFRSFEKHSVSSGTGRAIGDTMLHNVNVNTGPQRFGYILVTRAFYNLLNRKVLGPWVLPVKQSRCNPDFVGDLKIDLRPCTQAKTPNVV